MLLCDVNVLVYAHREESAGHDQFRGWLEALTNGEEAYGVSDFVLSGFIRIVTHPRIFRTPTPRDQALDFADRLRGATTAVAVQPGTRHWGIFVELVQRAGARGNLVPDAFLAALAIDSGSELITTDRDYARFPGLRWRHPLFDQRP